MPTDTPAPGCPPIDSLESVFSEEPSIEERIYSLLVETTEGVTAPAVAEQLSCSTDTARKYLNWFSELGIASKHDGRPVQYERNTEYFEWRYVNELANTRSLDTLRERVIEIQERIESFRDRYDATDPARIDVFDAADRLDMTIADAWDDLSTWASLEDELRLHDRARRRLSDRATANAD
ncbi:DUF7342 family protein [Halalkalirubrum salinum]|uniref:DUF7342 family protein n=1 Tax=Halalkalirubrum salinum TaxID=2563889 RepID=UPI0010FBAE73|nr:sugar-specific transcriptional regulator TrmB [Halalkalirubrum salinum]